MKKKTALNKDYVKGYNEAIDECAAAVEHAEMERDILKADMHTSNTKCMDLAHDLDNLRREFLSAKAEFSRMEDAWRKEAEMLRGGAHRSPISPISPYVKGEFFNVKD